MFSPTDRKVIADAEAEALVLEAQIAHQAEVSRALAEQIRNCQQILQDTEPALCAERSDHAEECVPCTELIRARRLNAEQGLGVLRRTKVLNDANMEIKKRELEVLRIFLSVTGVATP